MIPVFDESAVRSVLRLADLLVPMREALIAFSAGHVTQPPRQIVSVTAHGGFLGTMPAFAEGVGLGAKLVTVYPANASAGLPTHLAVILLFQQETGKPLALLDGRLITELRTAAVSAVAVDALAAADVDTLGVLGSGVQAQAHIEALRLVRPFRNVRVWSRTPEKAARLAGNHGITAVSSAQAAVEGAQLVVVATSATTPVLAGEWLAPGTVVVSVGWPGPSGRELDDDTMGAGPLIVDTREGVAREAGDVILSGVPIYAELGEILAGTRTVPAGQTVVVKTVGMATEDIAVAALAYRRLSGHAGSLVIPPAPATA